MFANFGKFLQFFFEKNVILELCKGVYYYFVDLCESFQTHIYLQNLASIQPRTSPLKFVGSRDSWHHRSGVAAAGRGACAASWLPARSARASAEGPSSSGRAQSGSYRARSSRTSGLRTRMNNIEQYWIIFTYFRRVGNRERGGWTLFFVFGRWDFAVIVCRNGSNCCAEFRFG